MGAFEAVRGFLEDSAERLGLEPSLREILSRPQQELVVQVRVPLDDGTLGVYDGFQWLDSHGKIRLLISGHRGW